MQAVSKSKIYHKIFQSKISRLPAYLTIQFVRFYYKEKESINAKILKDVKFPLEFDAFELCTPELQEKLAPVRAKFKVIIVTSLNRVYTVCPKRYTTPVTFLFVIFHTKIVACIEL